MRRRPTTEFLSGWTLDDGASWRARAALARFSDENVLRILRAGDAGLKVAEICAAENIPAKTYYQWKVKYGDLEPSEFMRMRRRERWYRRAALVLAAVSVLGIGYLLVLRFGGAPAHPVSANPPRTSVQAPARGRPVSSPPLEPAAPPAAPPRGASPRPTTEKPPEIGAPVTGVETGDITTAEPGGYSVQVAAVSTLQEARNLRERLARAGHSAYLTRATAGQVEVYRVRVGPFESRLLAEEAVERLARDGYRSVWIAKQR